MTKREENRIRKVAEMKQKAWKTCLDTEGILLIRLTLHTVVFGENGVCEEVVGVEVEGEGEAHHVAFVKSKTNVPKVLKHLFVILTNNFH